MPRDVAGNFTLDPSNPVVSGEVIESDWANPTLTDIAAALTDSLSRSGAGGMLSPLKFSDGSRLAPGASWTNEPTSGWYRAATNEFRFAVATVDVLSITPTGLTFLGGTGLTGGAATFTNLTASVAIAAPVITATGPGAALNIQRRDTSALAWIMYSAAGNFQWYDGSADRMSLTPGPSAQLSVAGSVTAPLGNFTTRALIAAGLQIGQADAAAGRWLFSDPNNPGNVALRLVPISNTGLSIDVVLGNSSASEKTLQFQANGGTTTFGGLASIAGLATLSGGFTAPADCSLGSASTDSSYKLVIHGISKGIRFGTGPGGSNIQGVDTSGSASFQPLSIDAAPLTLQSLTGDLVLNAPTGQIGRMNINGATYYAWSTTAFFPASSNVSDLGGGGNLFRTGYFGTSVVAPTFTGALNGNAATATTAAACSGNAATSSACTGNAATATSAAACTGNAASATKLQTARTINGVPFDGTANITIPSTGPFVSGEFPIAVNLQSAAHGLGSVPSLVTAVLRCKAAQFGYAIGDEIDVTHSVDGGGFPACAVKADATNVYIILMTAFMLHQVGVGRSAVNAGNANWAIVLRAWK